MATARKTTAKQKAGTTSDEDVLTFDYETSLRELETIVERMESGEQTLEATIKDFERGMTLSKASLQSLTKAEQRIDKLVQDHVDDPTANNLNKSDKLDEFSVAEDD